MSDTSCGATAAPSTRLSPGGGGWASGGGISEVIALPSYQASAKLPVSIDSGKPGSGVPDIAMSATHYFTRVDSSEGASGGTSAVAPLMSALVALLNQAKQKKRRVSQSDSVCQRERGRRSRCDRGHECDQRHGEGLHGRPRMGRLLGTRHA